MEVLGAGICPHVSALSRYQEKPSRAHGGSPTHQRLRLVQDDHQHLPTELNQVKKRPASPPSESGKGGWKSKGQLFQPSHHQTLPARVTSAGIAW